MPVQRRQLGTDAHRYANQIECTVTLILRAKYGPNWGLKGPEGEEEAAARQRRREVIERANRRAFEAECLRAGYPKDSPISPTLAAIIRAWSDAEG